MPDADSPLTPVDPNAPTRRLGNASGSPASPTLETDATLLDAEAPTVLLDERVAAVDEPSRQPTIILPGQAATIITETSSGQRTDPPAGSLGSSTPPSQTGVRYVVVGLAGRGGMGTVHVARDVELLRRVALKELGHEVARDRSARARFVREVQVTAQLDHPHIVPVYSLEVADGGRPAYAMKLVEGRTFSQLIAETKASFEAGGVHDEQHSLAARLEHFLKVCDAVEYAHARGVVHRDLKPANLMLGRHNEVYVMDWGICRVLGQPRDPTRAEAEAVMLHAAEDTKSGAIVGTPLYMSPEQAQGRDSDLDFRSDQCALGLILFELVTLRRPFEGRTTMDILERAAAGARESVLHAHGQDVPREVAAVIERATARDPASRYRDVGAFAADIRRFLRGEAVDARPETAWQRLVRALARHRQRVAFGILAFAVISLSAIAGLVWRNDRALKAQQFRERRIEAFANQVSRQGDRLQTRLLDLRGELDALAMVASYAIEFGQPSQGAIRWLEGPAPDPAPNDGRGAFALLPGARREEAETLARRLLDLQTAQHEVVDLARQTLGTAATRAGDTDAVQELLAAFDIGLLYFFPVSTRTERPGDPRATSWYRDAAARPGAQWEALDAIDSHAGRELVVSEAVRTSRGQVRGVIGLVLSLDHALTNLVAEGEIPGVRATLLLDRDGAMLATRAATNGPLAANDELGRGIPVADIQRAIEARDVGFVEIDRLGVAHILAFDRIHPLDWMLLSIVEERTLLESATESQRR